MTAQKPEAGQVLGPPLSEKAKLSAQLGGELKTLRAQTFLVNEETGLPLTRKERAKRKHTKTVVFNQRWKRYHAGDAAGFPPKMAQRLVDSGAAHWKKGPVKRAIEKVIDAVTSSDEDTEDTDAPPKLPMLKVPPTLEDIMEAGAYTEEAALRIVLEEEARAADGVQPYGKKPATKKNIAAALKKAGIESEDQGEASTDEDTNPES